MPIRAASRAAAVRDETPILERTAETRWCTARAFVIRAPSLRGVWTPLPECFSPQHARKGVAKDGQIYDLPGARIRA
jgi:hypothetical protein